MTVTVNPDERSHPQPLEMVPTRISAKGHPFSTPLFDGLMFLTGVWTILGASFDAWAHNNRLVDNFFTPWHGVLYSGFIALALCLFWQVQRNQAKGFRLWQAIPVGYEVTVIGAICFAIGGVGDMLWHTIFGVELQLEALFSPSHFLLIASYTMVVTGPFRSVWWRRETPFTDWRHDWKDFLPLAGSLILTVIFLTISTTPFQPFYTPWAAASSLPHAQSNSDLSVLLGIPGIFLNVTIFSGILLLAVRRFRLLPGTVTVFLTLPVVVMGAVNGETRFIPFALTAGLISELVLWQLRPSPTRILAYRVVAFTIPFIFYCLYFAALAVTNDLGWKFAFWGGAIFFSGAIGLLISYLIIPSPLMIVPTPPSTD